MFSVIWMDDSDEKDLRKEVINEQFDVVKQKTNLSNVMKYGDLDIMTEIVGNFEGIKPLSFKSKPTSTKTNNIRWPSRDIPLLMLESRLKKTVDPIKREELSKELEQMKMKRVFHDLHTRKLAYFIRPKIDRYLIFQF